VVGLLPNSGVVKCVCRAVSIKNWSVRFFNESSFVRGYRYTFYTREQVCEWFARAEWIFHQNLICTWRFPFIAVTCNIRRHLYYTTLTVHRPAAQLLFCSTRRQQSPTMRIIILSLSRTMSVSKCVHYSTGKRFYTFH